MSDDVSNAPQPITVTLKQISAWDLEYLKAPPCAIKASVPALQRGLVWSPHQVELLWDSLLRGFPVGSLVVTDKVEEQERSGKTGVTRHLLDGQQRCNAITLGFHDPFAEHSSKVRGNKSESILWLDLAPNGSAKFTNNQIPEESTRNFLTRVTTLAHPWGFRADDKAKRITASEARAAIEWEYYGKDLPKQRPSSLDLRPWKSNSPIPLAWLTQAIENDEGKLMDSQSFWQHVRARLMREASTRRWPKMALEVLNDESVSAEMNNIYLGLLRVMQTRLVILEAPSDILSSSQQEKVNKNDGRENISNVEHLFNRLNSQGSKLDGEELAYSLIKAYWPRIADVIDEVSSRRVPASHLVSLGVRAALTDPSTRKLARGMTIPRLRSIAKAEPRSQGEAASTAYEHRTKVESFIGKYGDGADKNRLANACAKVDEWLSFHVELSPNGLPPVIVSSFARGSSDIYLFLLHLADRMGVNAQVKDSGWKSLLPGLVTLIHWFARPGTQLDIADLLLTSMAGGESPDFIREGVALALEQNLLIKPRSPDELERFIEIPAIDRMADWRWWHTLIEASPESERAERQNSWWPFLESIRQQRELLLYAQRVYINTRFPDYDPARKDLWENHNRPWDFDHLHAEYYFHGQQGPYADYCRQWGNCIGNLRAWPFEDNRSDQKDTAKEKLGGKPELIAASFIQSEEDLEAFSLRDETRHHPIAARSLSEGIKSRFIRIYREWYDGTGIGSLLPPDRHEILTSATL